jgi:hypothetical protein
MLCSSCNSRPGKTMHLEGSVGKRALCSRCAGLRKARIQRNRIAASLHVDKDSDEEHAPSPRAERASVVPIGLPVEPTPEFSRGRWRDASLTSRP